MKWFESREIKSGDGLSTEQINYLKKASFTVFGPFNILARRHWDFVVFHILTAVASNIVVKIVDNALVYYGPSFILGLIMTLLGLIMIGLYIWFLYFMIRNGRRLAWNRNNWNNFESFQNSEKKWAPWGYLVFGLTILSIASLFLSGFLE